MAARTRIYVPIKKVDQPKHRVKIKIKLSKISKSNVKKVKQGKKIETADEADKFYVIEKLLEKRYNSQLGCDEYLVRWENYSSEYDTWEPVHELERRSSELLDRFNEVKTEDQEKVYCICREPYRPNEGGMVQCFHCLAWFHFRCLRLSSDDVNSFARFYCHDCRQKDPSFRNRYKGKKAVSFYHEIDRDDSD